MAKPKILLRLEKQLAGRGVDNASAVAREQLEKFGILVKGTDTLTPHGEKRNAMSPAERAKDRASRYSGRKHGAGEYQYDQKTNKARLKK